MIYIIIGLAALTVFAVLALRHAKKRQDIPRLETEGVLTKVTMREHKREESDYHVRYEVDGKEYFAILGQLGAKNMGKTTPDGTKVTVLYNPENPQDAYAELRDFSQLTEK